ncbi:porin [Paraburkholderia phytofirmans]|uniref:porin n=1 Tax=Paraburkholderia phytofirmans TaxID=261302 RepID=UPI0038B94E67
MFERRAIAKAASTCLTGLLVNTCVHAQGSVTLYGVLDGGLAYFSKTANPATGQNERKQFSFLDSGKALSAFGLTGTQDLGGGLKATFRLESGVSMANGAFSNSNGFAFGRQAWIALDGRFGQVKAGVQYSPFGLAVYAGDPRQLSPFGSGLVIYGDSVLGTGVFVSNAVSYTTPQLFGLKGSVMYALGGKAGDFQAGRQYSASLNYQHDDLVVVAGIYSANAGSPAQTPVPTDVAFFGRTLGVSYKWGNLTAKASFTNYKTAGWFNNNVYAAGLDYLVTPSFDLDGGVWFTSDRNDTANHSLLFAMGGQYFLSKATTLYAQVAVVNNQGAMNTGLSAHNAPYGTSGTTTGVNVGIRHMF